MVAVNPLPYQRVITENGQVLVDVSYNGASHLMSLRVSDYQQTLFKIAPLD